MSKGAQTARTSHPLLDIRRATKIFGAGFLHKGQGVQALKEVNLSIADSPPRIVTIAGESGCGKSTLANAILGFVSLTSGHVLYRNKDVASMNRKERSAYRRQVQAVFQDPYAANNPFYTMKHVFEVPIRHFNLARTRTQARDLMETALNLVGLRGEEILEKHPHQMSGGQRQRIMMARAYLLQPRLIVADEPVSMVDASLRAMVLDIMLRMRDEHGISFLYITHDLSTAYQVGDDLCLIYRGRIVERGHAAAVIEDPKHPYVQLLLDSIPVPDPEQSWHLEIRADDDEDTAGIPSRGCLFRPRCPHRMPQCSEQEPADYPVDPSGHEVACFLYERRGSVITG